MFFKHEKEIFIISYNLVRKYFSLQRENTYKTLSRESTNTVQKSIHGPLLTGKKCFQVKKKKTAFLPTENNTRKINLLIVEKSNHSWFRLNTINKKPLEKF